MWAFSIGATYLGSSASQNFGLKKETMTKGNILGHYEFAENYSNYLQDAPK